MRWFRLVACLALVATSCGGTQDLSENSGGSAQVQVPVIVGESTGYAEQILSKIGLSLGVETGEGLSGPAKTIVEQAPAAGTFMAVGSQVIGVVPGSATSPTTTTAPGTAATTTQPPPTTTTAPATTQVTTTTVSPKRLCLDSLSGNTDPAECPGIDLSGYGIAPQFLDDSDFSYANLAGASLRNKSLHRANFSGAILDGADLALSEFHYADLSGASLTGVLLALTEFHYADLSGADLSGVSFYNGTWNDLYGANLSGANLSGVQFSNGMNMPGVDLSGANLTDSRMVDLNLRDADLSGANLSGANLFGVNLLGANLSGAILEGTSLSVNQCVSLVSLLPNGADLAPCATTATTTPPPTTTVLVGTPHPLTGLDSIGSPSTAPALAVKIGNDGANSLPQIGLESADIVYEVHIENGVTRFLAIFHSEVPESVGRVRSARSSDIDLLGNLNIPYFAYWGSNEGVQTEIREAENLGTFVAQDEATWPAVLNYYRDRICEPACGGLLNTPGLLSWATGSPPNPVFEYGDLSASATQAAGVRWTAPNRQIDFTWDDSTSKWLRYQDGVPLVDSNGNQIAVDNVLLLYTFYTVSTADDRSPQATSTGSGGGRLYRQGAVTSIRWSRPTVTDPWNLVYGWTNNTATLSPGTTWVGLVRAGEIRVLTSAEVAALTG